MTNGEKIRNMTDEELAEFFPTIGIECGMCLPCDFCGSGDDCCEEAWERWLKSEVKND